MAVGKTNATIGNGKLVTAITTRQIRYDDGEVNTTLTCEFDPLVICCFFKDRGNGNYNYIEIYRLSKDDTEWKNIYSDSAYTPSGIGKKISVNGRTITFGPCSASETAYADAYIRAFGLSD